MAATIITLYEANLDAMNIDAIVGATVKLHLITSSYTPSTGTSGHTVLADISANEISGGGYSGGITLGTLAKAAVTGGWKFSSADATLLASGAAIPAWRYGVLAISGSLWSLTNPLLGIFTGDNTPGDIAATADGQTLTVACPAGGWFDLAQ